MNLAVRAVTVSAMLLAVLAPSLRAWAHGGPPVGRAIRFPVALNADPTLVIDNFGVFHLRPRNNVLLCDEGTSPGQGLADLVFASEDASILVATTSRIGMTRSTDGGCNFGGGPAELFAHQMGPLLQHPQRLGELLSFTRTEGDENDVWRSVDAGATWQPAGLAVPGVVRTARRSEADPERVYVAHQAGAVRSDDAGETFSPIAAGLPNTRPEDFEIIGTHPVDPDTVYGVAVAFPSSTLLRSDDAGLTWVEVTVVENDAPTGLVFDRTGQRALMTTTFEGVFRSVDGGETWSKAPESNAQPGCLVREPATDRFWACGGGQDPLWRAASTSDLGETWQVALPNLNDFVGGWGCPPDSYTATQCESVICIESDASCDTPDATVDAALDAGFVSDAAATPRDQGTQPPPDVEGRGDGGGCGVGLLPTGLPIGILLLLGGLSPRRRKRS